VAQTIDSYLHDEPVDDSVESEAEVDLHYWPRVTFIKAQRANMQLQETMIERVRALCQSDHRVSAAMMYGSFTRGEVTNFRI